MPTNRQTRSLRTELIITVCVMAGILVFASAVATFLVMRGRVEAYQHDQLRNLADAVARQSGYALIVGAQDQLASTRFTASFASENDVVWAGLIDKNNVRVIVTSDTQSHELVDTKSVSRSRVMTRPGNLIHVVAPVFVGESAVGEAPPAPDGFVYVVGSTDRSRRLAFTVGMANIAVGVLAAGMVLWWGLRRVRRMTRPFEELSVSMLERSALADGIEMRAREKGAREYADLARAFNVLMQRIDDQTTQLRDYSSHLEERVTQRTRELQVAMHAAQSAVRYKNEIMSTVTHELKAPLYVIGTHAREAIGELEMIEGDTSRARALLKDAIEEAARLSETIRLILGTARVDRGGYEVRSERCDLSAFMKRLELRWNSLALLNRNRLNVQLRGHTEIWTDTTLAEHILSTLVNNACKFTHEGSVEVKSEVTDAEVVWEVVDTGCGIPVEEQGMLFQEFHAGNNGHRVGSLVASSGLGLSIAKRFSELLGGTIVLSSVPLVGTTVTVRLPRPVPLHHGDEGVLAGGILA